AVRSFDLSNTLPAGDDNSSDTAVPLGFGPVNFFGQSFSDVWVNNNGNLTFGSLLSAFTPNGLAQGVSCDETETPCPIIAPFFADVDTDGAGTVYYGTARVDGHTAFVATWQAVGYFSAETDKHNTFQVILIDRSDTGTGNFDIEMNYNQIQWETGDASGGIDGLGGTSAVAGFSNGISGDGNVFYQLPGSLVNGALLDGGPDALVAGTLNSTVPGRYVFEVRNGTVINTPSGALTLTGTDLGTVAQGQSIFTTLSVSGGKPPYSFSAIGNPPPGITVSGATVSGAPAQPGNYSVYVQVTDSTGATASGAVSFAVFGFTNSSLPPGILFSPYQGSVGVTGGLPPYSVSVSGLPPGLTAGSSGTIQGTVTTAGTYNVSVSATDSTGVSVSKTLQLTFTPPPPLSVPAQTLPAGQISTNYSEALGASGGAPPYAFSLSSGSLPAGLILRPTGVIAGIPMAVGTFSFGIRATDVTGASAVGPVTLTIAPAPILITSGPTSSVSGGTPMVSSSLANAVANFEFPPQTISATGGIPPYTFSVTDGTLPPGLNLDPSGMLSGTPTSSGNYTFTVTATDSSGGPAPHLEPREAGGSTGSATFSLNVRPAGVDLILSTSGLAFTLPAGSTSVPPPQVVGVQSTSTATVINYSVSVSPAVNWLNVSPAGGATPSALNISLNSQALTLTSSTTPYQTMVSVMCLAPAPCAGSAQQVGVSVSVANTPPLLNVGNSLISFTTPAGTLAPMSQTLDVQNAGGGSIGIASISCGASWCTLGPIPGSIAASSSVSIPVTVDPTSLNTGFYRTTITLKTSAGTTAVPVVLFVAGADNLSLSTSGAQYSAIKGGIPNGPDSNFLCVVSSKTPVTWNASVVSGGGWLSLVSPSGTASASTPGTVNFAIDPAAAANLDAKTYYGVIRVTIPGFVNSPQDFEVILNVSPANAPQRPNPSPTGLLFITAPSGTPPAQTVTVSTNAPSAAPFQVSATTNDGSNWLSVTPSTGSASPGTPATAQVSVDPSKLTPGAYYGGVNFAFPGIGVRTVNVTAIVNNNAVAHVASHAEGCTPTQLVPAQMGLAGNFAAPVAWPVPVAVQLLDDCADTISNGQVVVTFSNGDPALPLPLADSNTGLYIGTWTPRHASSQVSMTAKVAAPGLPVATARLAGSVAPNSAPILAPNAALNAYNPQAGAALAPGSLVQISGTALAALNANAKPPLPMSLNNTQVIVGGMPAPLSAVSPNALTAQLPFELAPNMQYQVIVSANGAL
ncbi:MAG: putative Ig domain-containing protein, partial [Acidobacteriota bacterium]|nr:putative Ig domain-containing protein [Acidobacteriota bacterium]